MTDFTNEPYNRKGGRVIGSIQNLAFAHKNLKDACGADAYNAIRKHAAVGEPVGRFPDANTPYGVPGTLPAYEEFCAMFIKHVPDMIHGVIDGSKIDKLKVGINCPNTTHLFSILMGTTSYMLIPYLTKMEEEGRITSIPGFILKGEDINGVKKYQKAKLFVKGHHSEDYVRNNLVNWRYSLSPHGRFKKNEKHTIYDILPTEVLDSIVIPYNTMGTSSWYASHKGVSVKDASGTLATTYRVGRLNGKNIHKTQRIAISNSGRVHIASVYYRGNKKVKKYNDRELYDALFSLRTDTR